MGSFQVAQFNLARLRAPLDAPGSADFVAALEPINALADKTPGFVWRLQTDEGNATSIHLFDDDMIIVNMSVWETVEALSDFTYRSEHRSVMARRREWFDKVDEVYLVLWWVPAGTVPAPQEGIARLERLRQDGPSPEAFTFKAPFPPPPEPGAAA
ncbi:MAG TPA: DUF3291 domain-containing protein [Acidimicrobiia bacterium]